MNPFRRFLSFFRPKPGMIGVPRYAHEVSADPRMHALDFAVRYADPVEYHVIQRMTELGIPDGQIGFEDPVLGGPWRAFFPGDAEGGGVLGNKIAADAGLFDADLMARRYGPVIGSKWEHDRLRDRLDQIIAHEHTEATGISHEEAVQRAGETPLKIRETARERLRAMAEAERRGKGR